MNRIRTFCLVVICGAIISQGCAVPGEETARIKEHFSLSFRISRGQTRTSWSSNLIPLDNDIYYPCLNKFAAVVSSVEDDGTFRTYGSLYEEPDVDLDCAEAWDDDYYSLEVDGNRIGGMYALRILANCDECGNFPSWSGWNGKIGLSGGVERYSENPSVPMYGATYLWVGFDSDSGEGAYVEVSLFRLMACVVIDRIDIDIPGAPGATLKRYFISNAPDYTYVNNPLEVYQDQISLGKGHCLHNSVGGSLIGGYSCRSDWGMVPASGETTADYAEIREDSIWPLYVFPTDNTWSELILSVVYQDREFYYRAPIPSLESNTLYRLNRVSINTIGNPDPDFPQTISLPSTIQIEPWSSIADYSENF